MISSGANIPAHPPPLSEYISKKERSWNILNFIDLFWGSLTILAVLAVILFCCRYQQRRKARCLVKEQSEQEKYRKINQALLPFGFAYSLSKDIFYSLEDAWQKNFGYGKIYDEMAPVMNMIIDCEPVYFEYGGRRWMIEFWKGQYGITTGAEVGIYVEKERGSQKNPEDVFYDCVSEEDQLPIHMKLYKNGKLLFQRIENHWWLTGFMLGKFSYPGELLLEVTITFEDRNMMEEFVKGCYRTGYRPEDLRIFRNQASLCIYQPKSPQTSIYGKFFRKFVQWQNRFNCKLYCRITKEYPRTIDKLYYLMLAYPRIFAVITKTGRIAWEKKRK